MAAAPSSHGVSASDVGDVAARLLRLEREIEILSERVRLLDERAAAAAPAAATSLSTHDFFPTPRPAAVSAARIITLTGRAVIALGLAYLLRAMVDAGVVPPAAGVWIGLVYALLWLVISSIASRHGDPLGAAFAGALTSLLAFPLISEAALRFQVWPAAASFVVLGGVAAAAILTSALNRQQSTAWIAGLGATVTAVVVMVGLRAYVAAEVFFIALGVGTLWLGYIRDWTLLRWPAAFVADAMALLLVLRALDADAAQSPYTAMAALLLLLAAYPLSIIVRTMLLNRDVVVFEIVQCSALLLLLRGALALSPLVGAARPVVGAAVVGLGVTLSAAAVAFARRRREHSLNTHFYASLGTMLLMAGGAILLEPLPLALFWMSGALVFLAVALRPARGLFIAYAAVLAIAAAFPSGLLAYASRALVGTSATLGAPPLMAIAGGAVLAAVAWLALAPGDPASDVLRRAAALLVAAAFLSTAAGIVAGLATAAAATAFGAAAASTVATIRTLTLSAAAALAASSSRIPRLAVASWFSYPTLALIALKLVAEDLRAGTPLALFVALAGYGAALIFSARSR